MDVVIWCPYERHKGVKHFSNKPFSLVSSYVRLTCDFIFWRVCWGSLVIFKASCVIHCNISHIRLMIQHGRSGSNMLFLYAMLCYLGVIGLALLTIYLDFRRFLISMSFRQRTDNHYVLLYIYRSLFKQHTPSNNNNSSIDL